MSDQPQARLIFEGGFDPGREVRLETFPAVVGRDPEAEVRVRHSNVSRHHARITLTGDRFTIEDLGSSNGTFVNGRRVAGPHPLADGNEIGLGRTLSLRFRLLDQPPAGLAQKPEQRPTILDHGGGPPVARSRIVVALTGREPETIKLAGDDLRIGRATDNDITVPFPSAAGYLAVISPSGPGYRLVPLATAGSPLTLDGAPLDGPLDLRHGMELSIAGGDPGQTLTLLYLSPAESTDRYQTISFDRPGTLTIGRDDENDIVLPSPNVSRFHATLERVGGRFRIRDLKSLNGTFVRGRAVETETWLRPGDAFRIGQHRFLLDDADLVQVDESHGLWLKATGLNKWIGRDLNILQDISLECRPREFIAVVGQSGSGKSTLIDALAGYRPATQGTVMVNDTNIYENFDAVRQAIGYVPQKDIFHHQLTVFQALDYAAQLRLPPDTGPAERHERVGRVLEELDLAGRRDLQISRLSGGQQKRVSIGIELLTEPGLFFLDEPTSGLDPGTETTFMQLMRRLADGGRTIILITHATKNVMLADKIVFLARGGHLAWFGPPEEALAYFDRFRSERGRRSGPMEFDHIYNLLDDPAQGTAANWAERFQSYRAAERPPARVSRPREAAPEGRGPKVGPGPVRRVSSLRQFLILSARNLKIITRDRSSLALMLLVAPLIACLDFVLAAGLGRNPFSFAGGNMQDAIVSLTVMINNGILVGGLSQMRELVKERPVYRRERLVNLRLVPYVLSKVWLALALAIYQGTVFFIVRLLAFDWPGDIVDLGLFYVTMLLLVFAGALLGLFGSALTPNANSAPLILILFLIPQIVLSGALVPLPGAITSVASSRWAFQSAVAITGGGSDVAADACWALPPEEQAALTVEEKAGCPCLGASALQEESCNFPGLGEHVDPAIEAADPTPPAPLPVEPQPPELPARPVPPPPGSNALEGYMARLAAYDKEVARLQGAYETELAAYQEEANRYQEELATYQAELSRLELARAAAVGAAETQIRVFNDEFGWAFVDKEDPLAYYGAILRAWLAQITIILFLLLGALFLQRRWDTR